MARSCCQGRLNLAPSLPLRPGPWDSFLNPGSAGSPHHPTNDLWHYWPQWDSKHHWPGDNEYVDVTLPDTGAVAWPDLTRRSGTWSGPSASSQLLPSRCRRSYFWSSTYSLRGTAPAPDHRVGGGQRTKTPAPPVGSVAARDRRHAVDSPSRGNYSRHRQGPMHPEDR